MRREEEESRVEDDRAEDGKQRMEEGGKGRRAASGSRRVAAGWFGAGGGSHSCSSASGRHFVLRERESLCGSFYERPGAVRHRILFAIVRSKVRASADAYERNDRRPSVFMFAVRGSGATRIIVVRGTQRARTPPPSPFNNRASAKDVKVDQ
ncbi:hypothetical protein QQF64_002069 [Cirrhinus molitorella]|uniref:Uncharacterized protein n=2 Tax=Cirrhinus molitorella TaxID=172907 RepID=A0ABR3MP56_9TELE|nr:hypothetical protein Q8A67_023489 [Cirrhinus molitorella]